MSIRENPNDFIFYAIKYNQYFNQNEPKFSWEAESIEAKTIQSLVIEDEKSEKNNIIKVYYFVLDSEKRTLKITYGKERINHQSSQHFIFDVDFQNYRIERFSQIEKFDVYQKFVMKFGNEKLKKVFYDDCINLLNESNLNFNIFMEIFYYFKDDIDKKNRLLNIIASSKVETINLEE